mmetsp:Transcript_46935/g.69460  ORF Transcript_46935/g.69460 Transcript_46935/m.69460 type:complete len:105 (-) Transcript_46935:874-1188(-)
MLQQIPVLRETDEVKQLRLELAMTAMKINLKQGRTRFISMACDLIRCNVGTQRCVGGIGISGITLAHTFQPSAFVKSIVGFQFVTANGASAVFFKPFGDAGLVI